MRTLHHWRATGFDPLGRLPNGVSMFFDHEPSYFDVVLTLQHFLGYMPYVSDKFPFAADVPNSVFDAESGCYTLEEPLQVQTQQMRADIIPRGEVVRQQLHHELLISPATPSAPTSLTSASAWASP